MIDITHKVNTLRTAVASAVVSTSSVETIKAIENKIVPKGDVFEMSRAAGLLGVKNTALILPDCHPMPIEKTSITYRIDGLDIHISVEVKTIYKTGVEVEAMHGASVVALNMYDMLKPLDKGLIIRDIKLESKKGGKSDFEDRFRRDLRAAVVVCSDSISAGSKEDKAGKSISEKLKKYHVTTEDYKVIPDEQDAVKAELNESVRKDIDILIFTGGTGLSKRDITPEALKPELDREIPGISEAIRAYGQERMPFAMLSRSLAGIKGQTLVLALPGSTRGAEESMDAIFPFVLHLFRIMKGVRHD